MENILFIVEGNKEEPLIIKTLISKFFKRKINAIISYDTNIHQLYDKLFDDDDIDIISLLRKQGKFDDLLIKSDDIAEKYLFFDLDPHDPSFNFSKISELVDFFNNETENGKLYINYPFSEALYEPVDSELFSSKVVEIIRCKEYKNNLKRNFVHNSVVKLTYKNLIKRLSPVILKRKTKSTKISSKWKDIWYCKISLQEWKDIIRPHIKKAIHLTQYNGNGDLHKIIFDIQVAQNSTGRHIYILSIYGIFICEYFKDWELV